MRITHSLSVLRSGEYYSATLPHLPYRFHSHSFTQWHQRTRLPQVRMPTRMGRTSPGPRRLCLYRPIPLEELSTGDTGMFLVRASAVIGRLVKFGLAYWATHHSTSFTTPSGVGATIVYKSATEQSGIRPSMICLPRVREWRMDSCFVSNRPLPVKSRMFCWSPCIREICTPVSHFPLINW
jgi:hypothetical protein